MINAIMSKILLDKITPTEEEYKMVLDAIRAHRITLAAPKSRAKAPKTPKAALAQLTLEQLLDQDIGSE